MTKNNNWEKDLIETLPSVVGPGSGAISCAYITAMLLSHGQILDYNGLVQLLQRCADKAKKQKNTEHYLEASLALSFLVDVFSKK